MITEFIINTENNDYITIDYNKECVFFCRDFPVDLRVGEGLDIEDFLPTLEHGRFAHMEPKPNNYYLSMAEARNTQFLIMDATHINYIRYEGEIVKQIYLG